VLISLSVVAGILLLATVLSLLAGPKKDTPVAST
jgi:hypothetical protein